MKMPRWWAQGCSALLVLGIGTAVVADAYDPPPSYYAGATGTGATLKAQLTAAMSAGHTQRTYGDFRNSAAFHDANPGNPGMIYLVYSRTQVSGVWNGGTSWNREHVWPESRQPGSVSNSSMGNLGDPHALRPCNPGINSARGNSPFGFSTTTGGYGAQGSYYFPGDFDKGDIARSLFYSDTRWTSLGISLVNTFPTGNQMGNLDSLIAWNYLDPPDSFERRRNQVIFGAEGNPFPTNNRNAFVDHPWFVWSIYVDQNNDSQVFVGDAPESDGFSETVVMLADALVGDVPQAAIVTVSRSGNDGTYFEVTPGVGAASENAGRYNAFKINTTGADSKQIAVGLDEASMATAGAKLAMITINNLDITTGAGAGRAANDTDDIILIMGAVLDHADASFDPSMNSDSLVLDLGSIAQGSGDAVVAFDLYNITAGDPMFLAGLDVEPDSATGDTDALSTTLGVVAALPSGQTFSAVLSDDAPGEFSATYTFRTFDDRTIATAQEGTPLTIHLTGVVTPAGCRGDATGDFMVDVDDLNAILSVWNTNVGVGSPLDLAGDDGLINVDDLNAVLGNWNSSCP